MVYSNQTQYACRPYDVKPTEMKKQNPKTEKKNQNDSVLKQSLPIATPINAIQGRERPGESLDPVRWASRSIRRWSSPGSDCPHP